MKLVWVKLAMDISILSPLRGFYGHSPACDKVMEGTTGINHKNRSGHYEGRMSDRAE